MKNKGMTQAFIGVVLGIIVLLLLISLTIKFWPSQKRNNCANNIEWDNFKTKLINVEDGIPSTTFFNNLGCKLVSFSLNDINSPAQTNKINPPQEIKLKQKPAICLCKINGEDCIINSYIKDCYLFEKTAVSDTQYNTGDDIRKDKNYIFITIKNKDSILEITDDIKNTEPVIQKSQQGIISPIFFPEQTDQIA